MERTKKGMTTMVERRRLRGFSYAVPGASPMPTPRGKPMTRADAQARLRRLVGLYGLHWIRAPGAAYIELAAVSAVLDDAGRREALGL